jgi:hypothetical protein
MNLNSRIFFVILPFLAFNLYAQDCKANLHIKTDLPSSKIYIDTALVGRGSVDIEIAKGDYKIVVMEDSDRWDAKSFTDSMNINNCNDTTLSYNFRSEIYLNTEPQDVYVYQDSELIGHTPLFLSLNAEKLILKKPGYEEKVIIPRNLRANEKIKLNFTGIVKGQSFFERNIFKILVGGIVALGGVSAYYKLKADNNFDQYQSTGEQYYLDQTHKFDLISGITFGALQVGFCFLIYHFLSD